MLTTQTRPFASFESTIAPLVMMSSHFRKRRKQWMLAHTLALSRIGAARSTTAHACAWVFGGKIDLKVKEER